MKSIRKIINDYFLKKRYIFYVDRLAPLNNSSELTQNGKLKIVILDKDNYIDYIDFLTVRNSFEKIKKRINSPEMIGVLLINKSTSQPIGYLWALIITNGKTVWHDSFEVREDEALLINTFVDPAFRRRGFSHLLKKYLYEYIFKHSNSKRVFNVVEDFNKASIIANKKIGVNLYSENYLIKFMGKNIFSIYKRDNRYRLHYLAKENRRNNL